MKRFDYRILVGAALILGGILLLLDQTGILKGAADLFWAGVLALGAAIFLFWFFSDRSKWWAAIPGFTLAGMAAASLLLDRTGWGGLAFLGGIGLGFWADLFQRAGTLVGHHPGRGAAHPGRHIGDGRGLRRDGFRRSVLRWAGPHLRSGGPAGKNEMGFHPGGSAAPAGLLPWHALRGNHGIYLDRRPAGCRRHPGRFSIRT